MEKIRKFEKPSIYLAQLLILPLLWTLRLFFVRDKLNRDIKNLDLSKNDKNINYILYANHQSGLDALIICASLPWKTLKHLLPFRFFVYNKYMDGPLRYFLNVMGGFRSHPHETKSFGLDRACELMEQNQTIMIFPSGQRTREKIAKRGVAVLAALPNTYLIPVHIDWKHRFHCHVHVGSPIKGQPDHLPEQLMEHVYDLPKKFVKI